jgi:hypothetical protein
VMPPSVRIWTRMDPASWENGPNQRILAGSWSDTNLLVPKRDDGINGRVAALTETIRCAGAAAAAAKAAVVWSIVRRVGRFILLTIHRRVH